MKKWISALLALVMSLSLCGCGAKTEEITITIDNWDQYFEDYTFPYIQKNSFNEMVCFSYGGSIKLKDGYTMAEGTKVAFEIETEEHLVDAMVDFSTEAYEFGAAKVVCNEGETLTIGFTDQLIEVSRTAKVYCQDGWVNKEDAPAGTVWKGEVNLTRIAKMLRAEGTLVLQKD